MICGRLTFWLTCLLSVYGRHAGRKERYMLEQYKDVLTVDELCEVLQIGKKLAYQLIHSGVIPARRLGRIYRISKKAVIDYLTEQV